MDPILSKLSQTAFTNTLPTGGGAGSSGTTGASGSSFQQMLNLQSAQGEGDMSNAKLMDFVDNTFGGSGGAGGSNLNAVDASSVHVDVAKASEVDRAPKAGQFFEVLQDINKDQIQFDNLKDMVSSGRTFKPQELLAMQVGVQHLSMELELFSKGLEQVNRTIQTPINMQIG
jgi:hypothetical protein